MLRRWFAVLLALVVLIVGIGFLLPTTVEVERSRTMDHPPDVIHAVVSDFRHFAHWSPWTAGDSALVYQLEGPASGEGATMVWNDDRDGGGRMRIVSTDPPQRVDLELELGASRAEGWFRIEPGATGQEVHWGLRMQFGTLDLVGRYVGLMLPGLVGSEYSKGLERLEAYLDRSPGQVPERSDPPGNRPVQ